MVAKFTFDIFSNKYRDILVNLPYSIVDRLDGLTDTISFEFLSNDDLFLVYKKNQKCKFTLYDDNNNVYKEYRMVVRDLTRDTITMYKDNNSPRYSYSCTISEPTVLIDECFRTNIAITPYVYAKDGDKYPYETLYDAYNKIMSSHNLTLQNERVYKTYKTQTNLNLPKEGVSLTGELTLYSAETLGYVDYVRFNKEELPISGSIYLKDEVNYEVYVDDSGKITTYLSGDVLTKDSYLTIDEIYVDSDAKIKKLLSQVHCPSLTYVDQSTFGQLTDVFDRVGAVPYLDFNVDDGRCFLTFYLKQGEFDLDRGIQTITNLSTEEVSKPSDLHSTSISSQIKNICCDDDYIVFPSMYANLLANNNYEGYAALSIPYTMEQLQDGKTMIETTNDNGVTQYDIFQELRLVVPNSFNNRISEISDPETYYLQLPTNIEHIKDIYYVADLGIIDGGDQIISITKIPNNRFVEYSEFEVLSTQQKKLFAYFVRGENKIKQPVALLASVGELQEDWKWSKAQTYDALRKARFIVRYKPMLDVTYSMFDFENRKSTTTKYIDMPFKVYSDKQASSLLSYEFEKYNSNKILFNSVKYNDFSDLNHYAGEKVYYKTRNFLQENFVGNYSTANDLYFAQPLDVEFNVDSWAKVGGEIYYPDTYTNTWLKYVGEVCVITKIVHEVNEHTVKTSYELSNKIATNNMISGYSDSVRVSDNLSTENVVTRNITYYKNIGIGMYGKLPFNSKTPSLVLNNEKNTVFPLFNGADNLLVGNAMYQMGCFGSYDDIFAGREDYFRETILQLNQCPVNIKQPNNDFSTMYETWTTPTYKASTYDQSETGGNWASLISWVRQATGSATYDEERQEFTLLNFPVFYTSSDGKELKSKQLIPTFSELYIAYTASDTRAPKFGFVTATSSMGGTLTVGCYYYSEYTDNKKTTKAIKEVSFDSSKVYMGLANVTLKMIKLDDSNSSNYTSHANPIFINSNNTSLMSYFSADPTSLGSVAKGLEDTDEDSNTTMWTYTEPLYYDRSDWSSELFSIGRFNNFIKWQKFEDIIKETGYDDLRIDLREKVCVNIQYVANPFNSVKIRNEFSELFPSGTYYNDARYYYSVLEINKNIPWFNNYYNEQITGENELFIKKCPKGTSIQDFIKNQELFDVVATCIGSMERYPLAPNITTTPVSLNAKITVSETIPADTNSNYVLVNKMKKTKLVNGNEETYYEDVPILMFSTEGKLDEDEYFTISSIIM